MSTPNLAIARRMFAPLLGESRANSLRSLDITAAEFKRLGLSLGKRYRSQILGVEFVVRAVRAKGALNEGSILKGYAPAGRLVNVIAPFDKDVIITDGVFSPHEFVWPGPVKGSALPTAGAIAEVVAGTGSGQWRPILNNDADSLTIANRDSMFRIEPDATPDALATALDATSDVRVYCDFDVVETSGATDLVVGAAMGAVTSGNFTLIVEEGIAPVRLDGSNAGQGATALGLIVPSATAGVARGITVAGITAAESAYSFAKSISAYSGAATLRLCQLTGRYAA